MTPRRLRRRGGGLLGNIGREAANGGDEVETDHRPPPRPAPPAQRPPAQPEPHVVGPLEAALRHPFLLLLPVILLVGGAAALGFTRAPIYTSQARISVGRIDVPAYTLQGVVAGNETLAAGYARTIAAEPVIVRAGRVAGLSPATAAARLSASPVPGSTLIRVEGTGPSKEAAVALANAGANGLISYVRKLAREQQSTDLLQRYRSAQAHVARIQARLKGLRKNPNAQRPLILDLQTAQLAASGLQDQFRASAGGGDTQNLLQLIAPASSASSDASSTLQRLGLIGGGAGLLVGLALALLVSNRRLLRRPRE